MEDFKKREFLESDRRDDDKGVEIKKLLGLINSSEYYDKVIDYFSIDETDETLIKVPGAASMFTILKSYSKRFEKIDLVSSLKDIYLDYTNGLGIRFKNIDHPYFNTLKINEILAAPIHSGERDFFTNLFEIDKYARQLIARGHSDILDENIELLKSKEGDFTKRYRLLYGRKDNCYFLRAIISKDRYYDYDNNLTFVIGLLKLHFEALESGINYELSSAEYNESSLRLYFKTSEIKEIDGVGQLQNVLLISNDEIKREALRFSNICSINFRNSDSEMESLFLKPRDVKTMILSIKHGTGPKKAFQNLENFVKSVSNFEELSKEINSISRIKDHNQIIHLVKSKIERSNTESIKWSKEELKKILLKDITNTATLLETFNKLILLKGLEIDAKEYLRYLIYQALINHK